MRARCWFDRCWMVLVVECKRTQQLQTIQGRAVYYGKDTTHKTLSTYKIRLPSCCQYVNALLSPWRPHLMCVRGPNSVDGPSVVARRFGDHGTKKNVGSCWLKNLTSFKHRATARNNMQQDAQTDATCNTQQWCVSMHGALVSRKHVDDI